MVNYVRIGCPSFMCVEAGSVWAKQLVYCFSSKVHGDLAEELAEPYYLYGKALIELARSESTLLGTGIPGTV